MSGGYLERLGINRGINYSHVFNHILTFVSSWVGTLGAKKKICLGPRFQNELARDDYFWDRP